MLVEVYRNLNRKCLSVRDPVLRKVVGHVDRVLLFEASFRVSAAGRRRVLRERRKNVHAVVRGLCVGQVAMPKGSWERIHYDPYTTETFVWKETGEPVFEVRRVYIGPEGAYAERGS